jgi:hypothetical protein
MALDQDAQLFLGEADESSKMQCDWPTTVDLD